MKIAGRDIKVFNLIFCGVGIAILLLIGIYPAHRTMTELDQSITKLQSDIEAQKLLFPVFIQLLKRSRQKSPSLLPAPEPQKLPRGDTSMLSQRFKNIAAENGVEVKRFTPDLESLIEGSGRLKMIAAVSGTFPDIREFLIRIGAIPFLDSFEYIQLQAPPDTGPLELTMRFWVRQE